MLKLIIILAIFAAAFVLVTYNTLTKQKNRLELAEQELRKYEAEGSDKDIDNARKYYIAVLRDYNTRVESFPSSLVANAFNFPKMHTEEFDEGL